MSGSNARSNAIRAITSYKPDLAPLNYADTTEATFSATR